MWHLWRAIKCSVGEESTCNAGDPGSTPGLERYVGEGIGYPLPYCASLVAQMVKNQPVMQETWVWSLGWEDPLEKGKATHSSILAWKIPWTVYSPCGRKELDTTNQSILKETSPGCSLEGLMLRLKLQHFGHLMWRADSLETTLMLGKTEGKEGGWQRMASPTQWT